MDAVTANEVITGLVAVLIFVTLAYRLAPVDECDKCPHCRAERLKKQGPPKL